MSSYLRDIGGNVTAKEALAVQTVTQTSTGVAQNMISGDGRVNCMVQVSTFTATTLVVRVQGSTVTSGTFTDISGASGSTTAAGIFFFTFDRPASTPALQAAVTINGTTAILAATFLEQTKIF